MGYSLYLYRAPPDAGPMRTWEASRFLPLGTFAQLRAELERHLPGVAWERCEEPPGWSAMSGGDPWFLACRTPGTEDEVQMLSISNADRSLLQALTRGTDRRLFEPESCAEVTPEWVRR